MPAAPFRNDRLSEDPHLSAFFQITTEKARFHKGADEAGNLGKPARRVKVGASLSLAVYQIAGIDVGGRAGVASKAGMELGVGDFHRLNERECRGLAIPFELGEETLEAFARPAFRPCKRRLEFGEEHFDFHGR